MADAPDQFDQALIEAFKRLGMSESSAAVAACGRPGSGTYERDERSPFDTRVDRFRKLGMSESGAKTAAIGREYRSESEARQAMGEGAGDEDPLTAAEHKRINESVQFKRYMQLRESGVGPWEAAEQATREVLRERYKLATNSSRTSLSESAPAPRPRPMPLVESSTCSCGATRLASVARCPRCGS